uniref:ATP synthase subunit a n=1 Tax=Appendiseta robiniae TaxID=527541 RepID=A0A482FIP7_9HEMI|nr:ATP synthase F0 subunit 6 [Appendiseta robiniae]
MTTNLFNSFDPSTLILNLELNWMSTIFTIIMIPNFLWIMPNRIKWMINKINIILNNEMLMLFKSKKTKSPSLFLFISLFMFIFINNFFSINSFKTYNFLNNTSNTLLIIFYYYINNSKYKNMIAHLIPLSTPIYLAPLMTIIETMSIIIRPFSLSIRLTANMIAGHLLMTLLNSNSMMVIILMIQMFMMMFELCVAMIQSYVFSILSSLYSSE